ncbi:glycosyltransferase family 4 protein [Paraburkholderia sp. BL17N1]|uniref:glycosyltransferase family 4 protein n=1 Tax=Paraburkholderia sp. BL17N1 TaxID=1938798 RepID=UPI000EB1F36A|nr:glycosyltransferase family 4 protein [Paraburkholderia sp. BL17N1]RKR37003.1 glycosyltransferase involved in cell wall biosynthesis [Paraburkholderia sp. BL17N1]
MSIRILHVGPGRGQRGGIASVLSQLAMLRSTFEQAGVSTSFFETRGFRTVGGILAFAFIDVPSFVFAAKKTDVVHFHVSERGSLYRKFVLFLVAAVLRKRTVFHLHSGNFERFVENADPLTRFLCRSFLQRVDCVIAVSTPLANWLQSQRGTDAVHVVGNMALGAEQRVFTHRSQACERPYIAFAGRLSEAKGLEDLFRAVAELTGKGRDIQVRVAGMGDVECWRRIAFKHGIADRVIFEGWLEGDAKLAFYRGASLFCMPSHFESFGIATLEAMFCSLPVVGTRLGGFLDLVVEGVSGYLVDVRDSRALADAISKLLDDPGHARKMGVAGLARACALYRSTSIVQRYVQCYRNAHVFGAGELVSTAKHLEQSK